MPAGELAAACAGAEPVDAGFADFVRRCVAPSAGMADLEQRLPDSVIESLRAEGYLGAPVGAAQGGLGMDPLRYGLLTLEVGRACASARTLLTVHNMVALTLERWGNAWVRNHLLTGLATGSRVAALALSETGAGSDPGCMLTRLDDDGAAYRLNGAKTWTSFGAIADWFLVFAQSTRGPVAVVVQASARGVARQPVAGMIGARGGMMASLEFRDVHIAPEQVVGRHGVGLSHIAATALDHGRYSVAWGAVAVAEAALGVARQRLSERSQFGGRMSDLPLAREALSQMYVRARAAWSLCAQAGRLRAARGPQAVLETLAAKQFAAETASLNANDAVRLCGAQGLCETHEAARWLREAKVLEVIEGSRELNHLFIGAQLPRGSQHG
jgi:glutaryl-CoA dehydrogenase (non-decarboxylating)